MPDSRHRVQALIQSDVLEHACLQHALFLLHSADRLIVDGKLDRLGVAVDLDVADRVGAVRIAAARDVYYGLAVPIRFVEIEWVFLDLAVESDELLGIDAADVALVAKVGGEIEHVPVLA